MPDLKYQLPLADGTELVFEQSYTEVRTMGHMAYDPDWRYTDEAGHEHYREDDRFPTLDEQWDHGEPPACSDPDCRCYADYGDDPYFLGYTCKLCEVRVEPGKTWKGEELLRLPSVRGLYRRGRLSVTAEEARALFNAGIAHMIHTRLGGAQAEIDQYLGEDEALAVLDEIGVHPRVLERNPQIGDMFRKLFADG